MVDFLRGDEDEPVFKQPIEEPEMGNFVDEVALAIDDDERRRIARLEVMEGHKRRQS